MKTLKQWHEELGEEFYKTEFKSEKAIFSPKFICNSGHYCGLDRGSASNWDAGDLIWTIYTPPKQKVVRWLWSNENGSITVSLYSDEELQFRRNDKFFIKLEWSRTEFEG